MHWNRYCSGPRRWKKMRNSGTDSNLATNDADNSGNMSRSHTSYGNGGFEEKE